LFNNHTYLKNDHQSHKMEIDNWSVGKLSKQSTTKLIDFGQQISRFVLMCLWAGFQGFGH